MSEDPRTSEQEKREIIHRERSEVVEGSGRPLQGRSLPQMVSVRLDADLAADLRKLAKERGLTVSDLLREAAGLVVTYANSHPYWVSVPSVQEAVTIMSRITESHASFSSAYPQEPAAPLD